MRFVPALAVAGVAVACALVVGCAFDTTGGAQPPGAPDPGPDPADPGSPVDDTHLDGGAEPAVATAFRVTELTLRDPHMFAVTGGFGGSCSDITDGGGGSVNGQIDSLLSTDDDGDGELDRGVVLVLRPFVPGVSVTPAEIMNARCTAPAETTACAARDEPAVTVARNVGAEACDVPSSQTTSDYSPPIEIAGAPCFATDAVAFEMILGTRIPMTDMVVAATYDADGARLTGVMRGFMSELDANELVIGSGPGATNVSSLLPGGDGGCADHDARDVGPDGESGWYAYFNFAADSVAFDE